MTTQTEKRSYLLYFIACFFVIAGAIGLIVTNTGSNTRGVSTEGNENNDGANIPLPDFPSPPELPETPRANDPDSEVLEQFIDVNGRRRRFKIFVPGVYARDPTSVPLVFVFHGSLGTVEAIQESYGMDAVAETENFIAVYPEGEGRNFEVFTLENNKDVDFTLAMIDFMKSMFEIRDDAIYSTGYSNGGFLSTILACVHSDIFAAVAPMAGTFDSGVFPECSPTEVIPYLQIHGSRDNIVPYNGNRQIVSVEETMAFWANANGQMTTPVITEEEPGFELQSYPADNIVQHYRMLGIGHLNVIDSFPAQKIIDFFKRNTNFGGFVEPLNIPPPPSTFNDADSVVLKKTIDVNGRERDFNVFVPGVYNRNPTPVPLVFVFHGSLGTAGAIQGSYGMDEVAETENFIAVYPVGEGRNFEVFTLENNKDVDFTLAMIDHLKSEFQIRDDAIYSTGYSNGGFLSTILACVHPEIFAAVAPMAGTFDSGVFPECSPSEVIPYLQIHGSRDNIVPYNGNRQIVSVEETMAFWANANGQMTTPVITEEEPGFELQSYPADNIVQHYRMLGIGHLNVIDSFPAQKIIDFFKRNTNFGGFVEPLNIPPPPPTFKDADSETIDMTIEVDGRQRDFNIFVPGVYKRNPTQVPLVFVFHGSLGTAGAIQGSYGMDEVAESENFIVVYPVGEGRNFEVFTFENNKDIAFTLAMIDFIKSEYQIKSNSIYSTGYSNGGFLSTMLACAHSDVFAAVAPMAGTFDTGVFPECAPSSTIPYLQIHGSSDSIVPYNGNRQIVSVEETINFWANANGQDETPVVTDEVEGQLFSFLPDNIVQHYRLNRIGHLNVIDAFPAQTIIDFFKRVSDF